VSSPSRNRKLSLTTHELELLHAGLGVLIAHYTAAEETAIARGLALRVSRQLRLIAEHADLPDPALRRFFLKRAACWQVRVLGSLRVSKLLFPYVVSTEAPFCEEVSS
jgi:hypothetical protein